MQGLQAKQVRFCEEYIKDLNGKAAAQRAGYSRHSAYTQASRLLRNAQVRARIDEMKQERERRTIIVADNVVRELAKTAFMDIGDLFDDDGEVKPLSTLPEHVRGGIQGIEVARDLADGCVTVVTRIRMNDKLRALELLGKHLGMFSTKVEHSGGLTLEQLVSAGSEDGPLLLGLGEGDSVTNKNR